MTSSVCSRITQPLFGIGGVSVRVIGVMVGVGVDESLGSVTCKATPTPITTIIKNIVGNASHGTLPKFISGVGGVFGSVIRQLHHKVAMYPSSIRRVVDATKKEHRSLFEHDVIFSPFIENYHV